MIKIQTDSKFEYELDEDRITNFELLEAIGELEENPLLIGKVATLLLGKEQKKKLYDYFRTEKGMVPAEDINNEFQDLFRKLQEYNSQTKN